MADIKHFDKENNRYEKIINATNVGTWEWEVQTGKAVFNDAWANMIGYSLKELEPSIDTWYRFINPEDIELSKTLLERVFSKELPYYEVELRMKHKNGNWVWVLDKGEVITWGPKGEPLLMVGSHTDITQIKQAAKKVKESEEQLKLVLDSTASGIYVIDGNDICTYVNKSSLTLLGYDNEKEVLGKSIHKLVHHSHRDGTPLLLEDCFLLKSFNSGIVVQKDDIIWRKDGTWFPVSYSSAPQIQDGKIVGTVVSFTDITDRNKLINDIHYERNIAQMYLDVAGVMLMVLDNNGDIRRINHKGCEILKVEEKDVLGKNWFDNFIPKNIVAKVKKVFADVFEKNAELVTHHENEVMTASGENKTISWYNTTLYDIDNNIIGILSSGEDITESKKAQTALGESNLRFQTLFDKAPIGYQSLDINGCFREVNQTWLDMLGYTKEEVIGKWFGDFLSIEYQKPFRERFEYFKKKGKIHSEFEMLHKNGSKLFIEFEGMIGYDKNKNFEQTYCTLNDITERREATMKLRDSEEKYRLLYSSMSQGLALHEIITDEFGKAVDYIFLDINESYEKLLNVKRSDVIGKRITEVMPKVEPYWIEAFGKVALTGESMHYENYLETTGKYYSTYSYCPKPRQFAVLVTDISERVDMTNKLKESESRLDIFFHQSLTGFFIIMIDEPIYWNDEVDKEAILDYILKHQKCTRVNKAMLDQYDMTEEEFLDAIPNKMYVSNIEKRKNSWRQLLNEGFYHTITEERKSDGTQMFIEGDYTCMRDSLGRIIGYFGNQQDVTEKLQLQSNMEYLNNHDYLTDLYNRRYYFEQFGKLNNPIYYPLGIMMLDVNGLKIINDAFGHAIGDIALKTIGNVLKNLFGENDVVARIGGDEFAVLLPNTSFEKLQELKDQTTTYIRTKSVENIELSLAIGYELINNDSEDIDETIKSAENRMYRHKSIEGSSVRNRAINAILQTLTDKYETERKHSGKVSKLCKLIGKEMRLRADEIKELEQAGLFHDIGKISIPDGILNKAGKLTNEEYEIIKGHPEVGYQILRAADEYSDLAIHALHHHERWDGKGYPSGLKGEDIPLFSRIIGIADAYEAMTADRPYRKKMSDEYAMSEIVKYSGTQFDPKIAKLFVNKVLKSKITK